MQGKPLLPGILAYLLFQLNCHSSCTKKAGVCVPKKDRIERRGRISLSIELDRHNGRHTLHIKIKRANGTANSNPCQ